jgi:activator of 2-hydroxyglutaryl-CoA dehydratase
VHPAETSKAGTAPAFPVAVARCRSNQAEMAATLARMFDQVGGLGRIVKGKTVVPPVAFIGAVSQNEALVEALRLVFQLQDGQLFVPQLHSWFGAIGAAAGLNPQRL